MRIAVRHLEVINDLALIPDVVSRGENVNSQVEKVFCQRTGNAKACRRVLAISDDQVDGLIFHDGREFLLHDVAARPSEDIANEENAHACLKGTTF